MPPKDQKPSGQQKARMDEAMREFERAVGKGAASLRSQAVNHVREDEQLRQSAKETLLHVVRARTAAHSAASIALSRSDPASPRRRSLQDIGLVSGAAANVAAVGAEDAAAEARAATVDMPAPPPTAGEWRAACDAAVVSHYDFGVRATEAARRAQFTAQEPEDIFEGLAEDDMGARFSAVVVQASKKFAAEFPPLAKRTVATTLRVPRRPLGC